MKQSYEQNEEHVPAESESKRFTNTDVSTLPIRVEANPPLTRETTAETSQSVPSLHSITAFSDSFVPSSFATTFQNLRRRRTNDMATSPEVSLEELTYDTIKSRLVFYKDSNGPYLPEGSFKELVQEAKVQTVLEKFNKSIETTVLTAFVCNRAPRIFTTLVHIEQVHFIEVFFRNNFDDSMLPIPEILADILSSTSTHFQLSAAEEERKAKLRSIFSDPLITTRPRDEFLRCQWAFISPIFTSNQWHHTFCDQHLMPFIENLPVHKDLAGKLIFGNTSNFSDVRKIIIHRDHLNVQKLYVTSSKHPSADSNKDLPMIHVESSRVKLNETNELHPVIAVKKLYNTNLSNEDFTKVAEVEAENLQKLRSLNHPHLIKAIAWYTWKGEHNFMFPWANLGNLRVYREQRSPSLTKSYFQWIFRQFRGLADAVHKLHGSDKSSVSWRHGDLKPDNILCFGDSPDSPKNPHSTGTFVITDVGLTKKHNLITEERKEATRTQTGTLMYEPPETELDQYQLGKGRSRRYDIWSMGCIYLESIIWLLHGPEGLKSFSQSLRSSKRFYELDSSKEPRLHKVVEVWVETIKEDPRCPPGTALRKLLDLVIEGLLNTDMGQIPTTKRNQKQESQGFTATAQSNDSASELPTILIRSPTSLGRSETFKSSLPKGRMSAREMFEAIDNIYSMATASSGATINWMEFDAQPQLIPSERQYKDRLSESDAKHPISSRSRNRNEEYRYTPLDDRWKYESDAEIARALTSDLDTHHADLQTNDRSRLCGRCVRLELWTSSCEFSDTPAGLEKKNDYCALCLLLHRGISNLISAEDEEDLKFSRVGSSIACSALPGQPIATLCTLPKFENTFPGIQLGLPRLSEPGSSFNINTISTWVGSCDRNHRCLPKHITFLPTRVLDVGHEHSSSIRLTCIDREHATSGKYLALSHRWGSPTTNTLFRTLKSNLDTFKKAIQVANLPKTFQHAVEISRKMNIQYLWIDSLCIVQDDPEDWDHESRLMEQVFSSAYATIAATCASGTNDGFLKKRPERQSVIMAKGESFFFVCEAIDHFHEDVNQADLNKRGWVLQERALSRRTLHFTETQCYWECGGGVRCETLTKMKNRKASFLGDADFPRSVESDVKGMKIELFQDLYSRYSKLSLTYCADRPVAIRGLEKRIIQSLKTAGAYGVFDIPFFHRCLLWRRSGSSLKRITTFRGDIVPSWSWMAYQGGIDFIYAPGGSVDWAKEVKSPFTQLDTSGSGSEVTYAKINAPVYDFVNTETVNLVFDEPADVKRPLKRVIIEKSKKSTLKDKLLCYVLVVQSVAAEESDAYERVGVALLDEDRIALRDVEKVVSIQ